MGIGQLGARTYETVLNLPSTSAEYGLGRLHKDANTPPVNRE